MKMIGVENNFNYNQVAALAQARVMSVSRLYRKMGNTTRGDFAKVRDGFAKLYLELK